MLKVNRSLGERYSAMRQAKALRKVNRLRGLPKSRFKRIVWRLHPRRLADFWFSRDGAIMALKIVGIAIMVLFIITLGVFAYFRKDLKSITDISGSNLGGSISYYDRTGKILLWQDYNAVKRVPVPSNQISPYLKEATVAVEDKNFYSERGFDPKGYIRAAVADVFHEGGTQGASTITQQLVKLTRDYNQPRTLPLKLKELILAVELERTYTKDQILTSYLNIVPYGGVDYGAQAAASDYFHKNASELTLPEAAMLAAIPKAPSLYSPYDKEDFDKKLFLARYDYVLDQMAAQNKISQAQANAAKKHDVLAEVQPQQTKYAGIQAPYFVLAAKRQLDSQFGASTANVGGWKVITTLDMNMQKESEQRVSANLPNVESSGGDEEATVTEDVQTGQMMALVGGTNFDNPTYGQINYAQWPISPGSSIKPYDYSALIQNTNAGAGSVLYDTIGPLPGYPCTNRAPEADGGNCLHDFLINGVSTQPGPMTIRYALGGSRNIPAVKATISVVPGNVQASINKVDDLADAMMDGNVGYHCYKPGVVVTQASVADQAPCTPSSGIGDGGYLHLDQHMNGLSTLGRMGQAIPSTYILKIYRGTDTKPFYQWTQPKPKQVLDPQTAYIVNNMLSDPQASYFAYGTKFQHYNGWDIAVKTGTTNSNYDGLMMAWTTRYAVGTWVGYHTDNVALNAEMENLTMPVTRNVLEAALDTVKGGPVNWKQPPGIQTLPTIRSHVAYSSQGPAPTTDIFPSWYKQKTGSSQNQTIDKVSGLLATSCTPAAAKQTLGGGSLLSEMSIDEFYPPGHTASAGTTVTASDNVHHCGDVSPTVRITPPSGNTCDTSCTLTATPFDGSNADGSDRPLNESPYNQQFPATLTIAVNGTTVCTSSNISSGAPVSCTYKPTFNGNAQVTASVTDSVLYSGSDSATVNFTKGAPPLSFKAATDTGGTTTINWTGGSGTVTVTDTSNGSQICTANASAGSCSGGGAKKGDAVSLTDGTTTATGTVSS